MLCQDGPLSFSLLKAGSEFHDLRLPFLGVLLLGKAKLALKVVGMLLGLVEVMLQLIQLLALSLDDSLLLVVLQKETVVLSFPLAALLLCPPQLPLPFLAAPPQILQLSHQLHSLTSARLQLPH